MIGDRKSIYISNIRKLLCLAVFLDLAGFFLCALSPGTVFWGIIIMILGAGTAFSAIFPAVGLVNIKRAKD